MSSVRRFVEDLLRARPIRRLRGKASVEADADAELRTAILLRSVRPGADSVDEGFVSSLHQRLAAQIPASLENDSLSTITRRRRFVQITSVAAASTALGVGLDRIIMAGGFGGAAPTSNDGHNTANQGQIMPNDGHWQSIVASVDLPEGAVRRFDLGVVSGFVHRKSGRVAAVSGICTHRACKLVLDTPTNHLKCPCHLAAFTASGAVLYTETKLSLPPLPTFEVREVGGFIQVYAPRQAV